VVLLVPRRWTMVRVGAVVYGLGVLLTLAVPSLIGSNAARLGELLVGPLLAGMGSPPPGRGAAWTEERGANPPFYDGDLTPATYRDWLRYNAVRYVALSTAPP